MTAHDFELDLTIHPDDGLVGFRLRNQDGRHLGAHQVRLAEHGAALWEGLFDTRSHVRRYAGGTRFIERPATAEDLLERIGVFLGEEVLGREVMDALSPGHHHRTLLVQLPETADDVLAAAFARVPWEIARPAAGEESLMQRNLVVRAVTPESADAARLRVATSPGEGETLRVLLVFAEAPGSRPQPLLPGSRELDAPRLTFVGRSRELTRLRERWLVAGRPAVAVVQGLAGLGKTALAAEAIHLWHRGFDGVFAFQSKPMPLGLDEFLRGLDQRLALHSQAYRELCDEHPGASVFLPPSPKLTGEAGGGSAGGACPADPQAKPALQSRMSEDL